MTKTQKNERGRRKILLTIWGFHFLQLRGRKNFVGVSILIRSALRGLKQIN